MFGLGDNTSYRLILALVLGRFLLKNMRFMNSFIDILHQTHAYHANTV